MEADRKYDNELQLGQEKNKIWYKKNLWIKYNNEAKNENREENKRIHMNADKKVENKLIFRYKAFHYTVLVTNLMLLYIVWAC